jgi:predicted TIM-barrel fold metal-dependent hydrolase
MSMYNDWVARLYEKQSRLMPVAILADETVEEIHDTAKRLIERGVRLFQILPDVPPGGVSPAAPEMDRIWALVADAGVAVLMHIGAADLGHAPLMRLGTVPYVRSNLDLHSL